MDSLESRLGRLSPEQRRSVEDYIDFLISRSDRQMPDVPGSGAGVSPMNTAPPPLIFVPESPSAEVPSVRMESKKTGSVTPPFQNEPDPATLLIQEIASEKEDILTAGYMDYGTFEPVQKPPPSPADDAVRRVKARLSGKKDQGPARNVLDWID